MDKNQIIGLVLMMAVFIGFTIYNQPSEEQLKRQQEIKDSLEFVQAQKMAQQQQELKKEIEDREKMALLQDSLNNLSDSIKLVNLKSSFGKFSNSALGKENTIVLENNLISLDICTKGAMINKVELKEFVKYDSSKLILFEGNENRFALDFFADNLSISTDKLYFDVVKQQKDNVVLRAYTDNQNQYIEYNYSLKEDSYLVDFSIQMHNLQGVINKNSSYIDLSWNQYLGKLERGNDWEKQNSALYYKYEDDDPEDELMTSDVDKNLESKLKWVAYKGQFFSSALINKDVFKNAKVVCSSDALPKTAQKFMQTTFAIPVENSNIDLAFYYGPNKFKILKEVSLTEGDKLKLEKLVPLGWGIFGWVNRVAIIPLFNWLGSFLTNYGLIILIMTIIIKLVIFPLTYKSYQSTAKMRVLKPQVDKLNEKYPKPEQAMQKQQATMDLYKRAGVNPLGGCLPLLLQMPILIAMFRFFPASIELRQQSFLWANDLSSYDSILDLPFSIPFYGDHISLFTLLMAGAIVLSTKLNSGQMDSGNQMPGMKMMMYLMPIMMVFWFNNYSSGLSYYYFLSNIITIGQTYLVRKFVDEKALLVKLNAKAEKNAKNSNGKKKSGFMARLEEMQRQQLKQMQEQQKNNKKK